MTIFRGRIDLLERFRDGERSALDLVYRAYVGRVVAIVRHGLPIPARYARMRVFGRRQDLRDVVQEIFMRAFAPASRAVFDGTRDYGPYLFALARNLMIDRVRRTGREVPTVWPKMEALANANALSIDAADADPCARTVVESYLDGLDSDLRAVHETRYQHGLTQEQGAAALGISRQSLRTLEQRLRSGLRRALEHNEREVRRAR